MVPDGTKSAASLAKSAAQVASSRFTVGSSPKTSSPTSAAWMAARIAGVGRVTVSLRKSITGSCMDGDSFDDSWKPTDSRPGAWGDLLSFILPLLLILQIPSPFDLAKEYLAI